MNLYENDWLYDLVHEKSEDSEQISFYEKQIERFGQPVLELACGTGTYLVTLQEKEVEIAGLDVSTEMLDGAEKRASRKELKSNLINADMRNFDLDEKFSLIFIAGNSLQHLNSVKDVESCFESVKKHLRPGGRFIVEVFNPSLTLLNRDPQVRYFVGEYKTDDGWIVIDENVFYDPATQVNHIHWHYKNQYEKEEHTVTFTMRQFFPQELDYLFTKNEFTIEEKFGDFDEREFDGKSSKQIVIATSEV
ncbi:MAG: class I SAM-dependent methyltransferase [Pyrinomonadaceae bacterium]|nr:class I SAM-dependent methyltransferase [Pyrinomonadaceae bacterium]